MSAPISYSIEPQIPASYVNSLFEFINRHMLLPRRDRFTEVSSQTRQDSPSLTYFVTDTSKRQRLKIQITGGKPLNVSITPLDAASEEEVAEAKEDIDLAVDYFEEQLRSNTIFFAWREGEAIVPEGTKGKESKSLRRILLETQVMLTILFLGLGLVLAALIGPLMPIVLLAIQFVVVIYSGKLTARSADWHITKDNPTIHLLEYPLPLVEEDTLSQLLPKEDLMRLKREIYEETLSKSGEIDCQKAHQIFAKYGINCRQEDMMSRKINVYETVKTAADKFGFPMPEVVVANTMLPNAAASGPNAKRGMVLITTGLFARLNNNEIVNILGHEFGHLQGHDPLWLYGLSAAQYLFLFYVIFGLLPINSFFGLLAYYWVMLTLLYFVAKFFEARADLTSAIVVGQPQVMANALEKIGFKQLLAERAPLFRVQEWIGMEPHPPIYFRVARLRTLMPTTVIKHPLVQSAKDVTLGFIHSL